MKVILEKTLLKGLTLFIFQLQYFLSNHHPLIHFVQKPSLDLSVLGNYKPFSIHAFI